MWVSVSGMLKLVTFNLYYVVSCELYLLSVSSLLVVSVCGWYLLGVSVCVGALPVGFLWVQFYTILHSYYDDSQFLYLREVSIWIIAFYASRDLVGSVSARERIREYQKTHIL